MRDCPFCRDFGEKNHGARMTDVDGDEAQILAADYPYIRVTSDGASASVNIRYCPWCGEELEWEYGYPRTPFLEVPSGNTYRGGAFDMQIPETYAYEDFKNDIDVAAPLVLCMSAKEEYKPFADMLLAFLFDNKQVTSAYGRITAYAERNNLSDIYGDWNEG